jgi:hypothetical protein
MADANFCGRKFYYCSINVDNKYSRITPKYLRMYDQFIHINLLLDI